MMLITKVKFIKYNIVVYWAKLSDELVVKAAYSSQVKRAKEADSQKFYL